MADLWIVVGFLAFFGTITGLLTVTFLAFTRMDKDVRRARMFIMEKRIQRFLGAFTVAFIALTVLISASMIAVGVPWRSEPGCWSYGWAEWATGRTSCS